MDRADVRRNDVADRAAWRPAGFGPRRPRDIADPIIEPVWEGRRVLVHVEAAGLSIVDAEGEILVGDEAARAAEAPSPAASVELSLILEAIRDAVLAGEAVLDGVLTVQASRTGEGILPGEVEVPTAGELAAQLVFGRRHGREDRSAPAVARRPGDRLTFVAVDLLALDGESLLEVPLLERKRLLESVLAEGPLVRRTAYVRLPVEPWLGSWRALGFRSLAYKAANSRYEPGRPNRDWAMVAIPRR